MTRSISRLVTVTPIISLEQLQLEDAEDFFSLVVKDRAYLAEFLPWSNQTKSVDDSRDFIKLMQQRRADGEEYGYAIKYDGKVVGHMSLMHLKGDKTPEIGYWIASEYSGKGVTSESVKAMTDYFMKELRLPKIIIRADPANTGSNRVAEKNGYTYNRQETADGKVLNVWVKERPLRHTIRGLIIKDRKILLVTGHGADFFWTPGGGVEGDETIEQTLRREIREELGVSITSFKPHSVYYYNGQHVENYLITVIGEPVVGNEVTDYIWYSTKSDIKVSDGFKNTLLLKLLEGDLID